MSFKKILFFALLFISINCLSQDKNEIDITDITKITFLNPGLSYEKRIGKFQSLYAQAFMNVSAYFFYSSSQGTSAGVHFDPALTLQYRYYYNAVKRQEKGKRTEKNSLNYISPIFSTVFSKARISSSHYAENNRRAINKLGLAWGFQRNYEKRFSLDLNLGLGYLFTKASLPGATGQTITKRVGKFTTQGQLNLGFWLNKVK